jgi:transcription elongation factor GreB
MSRAFVRESDDSDEDLHVPVRSQLPPGVKNLITPGGAKRLQEGLDALLERKRALSQPSSDTSSSENEAQSRKLQSRIRQLQQIADSMVVTPPSAGSRDRVCFGASVLVRHANGQEATYRIVGIDEIDLDRNQISWRSPLARALLSQRAGNRVQFDSPSGKDELFIVSFFYEE